MSIIEGNKLIAEFMGDFEPVEEFKPEPDIDVTYCWRKLNNKSFGYSITEWRDYSSNKEYCDQVCYNHSWNWLMPVVEKIETTYHAVIITQNTCIIKACIMNERTVRSRQVSNYDEENTKLSNTYKAVIEFIKWYNENKKS
jgi:hypothetical protein